MPIPADPLEPRLRAVANDRRRDLLRLVRVDERTVGDLAAATGLSQPATSQHLRVLRDAGLVVVRAEGTRRWYSADEEALSQVRAALDELWSDRLGALARHAEARAAELDDRDERDEGRASA